MIASGSPQLALAPGFRQLRLPTNGQRRRLVFAVSAPAGTAYVSAGNDNNLAVISTGR